MAQIPQVLETLLWNFYPCWHNCATYFLQIYQYLCYKSNVHVLFDSCFVFCCINPNPFFSCPVLGSLWPLHPHITVLLYLFRSRMHCVFCDPFLHTTVTWPGVIFLPVTGCFNTILSKLTLKTVLLENPRKWIVSGRFKPVCWTSHFSPFWCKQWPRPLTCICMTLSSFM